MMKHILIITTEDLAPCFNNYIAGKKADGFTVNLVTVEYGHVSEDIQKVLDSEPCNEPFFVIFGGLTGDVMTRRMNATTFKGGIITDSYYSSDSAYNWGQPICKYYIGRFPTNQPELMVGLCEKALRHRSISLGNGIILLSGDKPSYEYRKTCILPIFSQDRVKHYSLESVSQYQTAFSDIHNQGIVCYSGHGALGGWAPNVDINDFKNLFTQRCYIMGLCCDSNDYGVDYSFSAQLLIEKNAAGYLGSMSPTYSTSDNIYETELWKRYIALNYLMVGEWYLNTIFDNVPKDLSGECRQLYRYSLLGDPTLPLY